MLHILNEGNPSCEPYDGGFELTCDVCVVGLGTAGAIAAIAAAKRGQRVIGVDASSIPGGVGTSGCVWDYYYGAYGGLYCEINAEADRIVAEGRYIHSTKPGYKLSYSTPVKSLALERFFERYGVRTIYESNVTGVLCDGKRVVGVIIFDGGRFVSIGASVVIDGAEGAVCHLMGLPTLGGRKSDGKTARFSRTVGVMEYKRMHGAWAFNEDYANTTPSEAAAMTCRWASSHPCLAESYTDRTRLYAVGREIGLREVLCVSCERNFLFTDYLAGNCPENVIFYTFSPLDNANPDLWNEDEDFQDWQFLCGMHAYGVSMGVCPEMLIPRGMEGILLAGKHIGTGHTMTSTIRMRTDMEKCGEAAGVMAAMMCEHGCSGLTLSREHFDELRGILAESGCYDPDNDRGICDLNLPDDPMWKPVPLPKTAEELRETLGSEHPSLGLFAVRLGLFDADTLAGWLDADGLLRDNAAVALGMMGDRRALPVLREILAGEPVVHIYRSPHKYFFPWLETTELCNFTKAVCLVGRLGDADSLERLREIAAGDDKAAEWAKASIRKIEQKS